MLGPPGRLDEDVASSLTDRDGLSARWVFPVAGKPLFDAAVRSADGVIAEVRPCEGHVDLPTDAILPATVNLHTHLELSDLPEPVGSGLPLDRWVGEVLRVRANRAGPEDESASTAAGLREVLNSGSAAVLDIAQAVRSERPEVVSAYEILGLDPSVARARLDSVLEMFDGRPAALSPHAPYSIHPDIRDDVVRLSARIDCLVTTHLAESPAERQLLQRGDGPFADLLRRLGVWREDLFGGRSIASEIDALEACRRLVVAHGNDLRPAEYERLARRNAAVAFCPRTHRFFGYDRHPVAEMLEAGVNVGLGTDSRASNPDLSVWNEVVFLRSERPDIPPQTLIEMATVNGAAALGLSDRFGTITAGRDSTLLRVPLMKPDATEPYEALFG